MHNELDTRMVLRVFDKIRKHGSKENDHYQLEGIRASADFDGYTLFIADDQTELTLGFHNTYHARYDKDDHWELFVKKLRHIDTTYQ